MNDDVLRVIPGDAWVHLLLTHGASERFDSPFQTAIVEALANRGVGTTRFEFDYLAQVRHGASRRPPPKMPVLEQEFRDRIAALPAMGSVFIGGKSMGGRVASLIANEAMSSGTIAGVICLGYPFHPVGKPETLRTAHLEKIAAPTLICQGTRDPFGTSEEVATYALSKNIEVEWLPDGDHGFKPRKRSGVTLEQNLEQAADAIAGFMRQVLGIAKPPEGRNSGGL